jgi:hypothetical protein
MQVMGITIKPLTLLMVGVLQKYEKLLMAL